MKCQYILYQKYRYYNYSYYDHKRTWKNVLYIKLEKYHINYFILHKRTKAVKFYFNFTNKICFFCKISITAE